MIGDPPPAPVFSLSEFDVALLVVESHPAVNAKIPSKVSRKERIKNDWDARDMGKGSKTPWPYKA
jgi:hypothetical protein